MREKLASYDACTLCMACFNACPTGAIYIGHDTHGYETIEIDSEKCIGCGKCETVCSRRRSVPRHTAAQCFAAQAGDRAALMRSASGGAFQMLALAVLEESGVCYGCTADIEDGEYRARHLRVESIETLPQILNSKYVPSYIGDAYRTAQTDLESGKTVLFSGTPCQIQGLLAFLGRDYENLLTADVICHGVTSGRLFNDYLDSLEGRDGVTVTEYLFRDKSVSWGTNFCYSYRKNGGEKAFTRHCPREESSYMAHYLRGNIFRENCYQCTLANTERVSDFTLGDYWEIENEHPEFVTEAEPPLSLRRGVSCILANTKKAERFMPRLEAKMTLHPVTLESITAHNGNLRAASKKGSGRDTVFSHYANGGYKAVDDAYRAAIGNKKYFYRLKNALKSHLPDRVRILCYRNRFLSKIVFR